LHVSWKIRVLIFKSKTKSKHRVLTCDTTDNVNHNLISWVVNLAYLFRSHRVHFWENVENKLCTELYYWTTGWHLFYEAGEDHEMQVHRPGVIVFTRWFNRLMPTMVQNRSSYHIHVFTNQYFDIYVFFFSLLLCVLSSTNKPITNIPRYTHILTHLSEWYTFWNGSNSPCGEDGWWRRMWLVLVCVCKNIRANKGFKCFKKICIHGGLHRGPCLLPTIYTLCHTHWMCCYSNDSFWSHDIYCSVHPEQGSSSVALPKVSSLFSPVNYNFFLFLEFFLIRCEVKGQGCRMCTDCKALWGEFVICDIGLYKINWI